MLHFNGYPNHKAHERAPDVWGTAIAKAAAPVDVTKIVDLDHLFKLPVRVHWKLSICF